MCTSLLPLAWSAMSPWRVLFSIEACRGLMPPAPRISARFLSSASLWVCRSIELETPTLDGSPGIRKTSDHSISPRGSSLGPQRRERFVAEHVEARKHTDGRHEQCRQRHTGRVLAGEYAPWNLEGES